MKKCPNNIGVPLTPFIGRTGELKQLRSWLDDKRRLISIVGPPGVGKTRLLNELGLELVSRSSGSKGGIWLVDLVAAQTAHDMVEEVASVLGVQWGQQRDARVEFLGTVLAGSGRIILLLDNLEQLVQHGAETIGRWLSVAPEAQFVVTSRERLLLAGEYLFELGPLPLPPRKTSTLEQLGSSGAGRLLLDRIEAVRPSWHPDGADVNALTSLLWELDGIPLAIELAASRARILSPKEILERLTDRFEILADRRSSHPRHVTLEACIDWSWDLLEPTEKKMLAYCTVFRGSFELKAAEVILTTEDADSSLLVLDLLQGLRDKSLLSEVRTADTSAIRRFRLFQSILEYARAKLDATGEVDKVAHRHARYFASEGERCLYAVETEGSGTAMVQLALERANLQAAIEFLSLQVGPDAESDGVTGEDQGKLINDLVQAALALSASFLFDPPPTAQEETINRVLEWAESSPLVSDRNMSRLRLARARRIWKQVDPNRGAEVLDEMLTQAKANDDGYLMGRCEILAHNLAIARGDFAAGIAAAQRAHDAFSGLNFPHLSALAVGLKANALNGMRRFREAGELGDTALRQLRGIESPRVRAFVQMGLAEGALATGRPSDANRHAAEARRVLKGIRDRFNEIMCENKIGLALLAEGKVKQAQRVLKEALGQAEILGFHMTIHACNCSLGLLELDRGMIDAARDHFSRVSNNPIQQWAVCSRYGLVLSTWESDGPEKAWRRAKEMFSELTSMDISTDDPLLLAAAGRVAAEANQFEEAEQLLDRAQQLVSDKQYQVGATVVALSFAHLQVARKRCGTKLTGTNSDDLKVARCILQADQAPNDVAENGPNKLRFEWSVDVRLAAQKLLRSLSEAERLQLVLEASKDKALVVDGRGRWYRPGGGEWVNLRRRRKLSRFLVVLVKYHADQPGHPLSQTDLAELVWPDERILPEALTQRVYSVVHALRSSGLGEVLNNSPDGYFLDPKAVVLPIDLTRFPNQDDSKSL